MVSQAEDFEKRLMSIVSKEYVDPLIKLVTVIKRLDDLGILDLLNDLIGDEEFLREIISRMLDANVLELLSNMGNIVKLISYLSSPRSVDALTRLIKLTESDGAARLLDAMESLTKNEGFVKAIAEASSSSRFINNMAAAVKELSALSLSDALTEAESMAKSSDVSTSSIVKMILNDPDVKRGLLFMLGLLKGIGKQLRGQ